MLSVVIPLFNKGSHIGNTIQMVLEQSFAPAEIIVVDDGSTDNGVAIVEQYISQGVCLIRQSNQGVSAARNTGLKLAKYPYVAFLDADDEWRPNHIALLIELIDQNPKAALLSTGHLIRRGGQLICPRSFYSEGWQGPVNDFFVAFSKGLSLVNSSTACVRKEALLAVGGFPVGVRRGEDVVTWLKLALRYPVAHAAKATVIFNQDAINRSDKNREIEPPGSLLFMHTYMMNGLISLDLLPSFHCMFDQLALLTAAGYRLNGDTKAAKKIGQLAYQAKRYKTAILIAAVNVLPVWSLRLARQQRHGVVSAWNVD